MQIHVQQLSPSSWRAVFITYGTTGSPVLQRKWMGYIDPTFVTGFGVHVPSVLFNVVHSEVIKLNQGLNYISPFNIPFYNVTQASLSILLISHLTYVCIISSCVLQMCMERGLWGAVYTGNVRGNDVIWRQEEINDLMGVQYRRVWTERAIKGCWERKR